MARRKKPEESVEGSYTPIPHAVLDSLAFVGASIPARAMLMEFLRQHNGRNNGRLQATYAWLSKRGWRSKEAIRNAVAELEQRCLVLITKRGGLNIGPTWYALTWLEISNHAGLDVPKSGYHKGAWANCKLPGVESRRRVRKRDEQPGSRDSTDPMAGAANQPTDPVAGSIKGILVDFTDPVAGHNECCQLYPAEMRSPRSGYPAPWITPYLTRLQAHGFENHCPVAVPPARVRLAA